MTTTTIEWTRPEGWGRGHTCNPGIYGCTEVSPACENCYAAKMAHRQVAMGNYPPGITTKRASGVHWSGTVKVDFDAIEPAFAKLPKKRRAMVFLTSMADLFHADVPDSFIRAVFEKMRALPHLTFLVLTKRAKRAWEWATAWAREGFRWPANVWIGTTVEDQKRANERIPWLLKIHAAPVRFLSMEPLREPVDLQRLDFGEICDEGCSQLVTYSALHADCTCGCCVEGPEGVDWSRLDWIIAGGESGSKAKPSHVAWFKSLRDQCEDAGVAFFFKQWGEWAPADSGPGDPWVAYEDGSYDYGLLDSARPHHFQYRLTRKVAGRVLDGREWSQFPRAIHPGG